MKSILAFALLAAASLAQAQTLYIPQIADGGGWQTTVVLTNTGSSAAPVSMTFYSQTDPNGDTQPWAPSFLEAVPTSIPAGSTVLLHTAATAAMTLTGWGAINAGAGVTAYAIFTQRVAGRQDQDGTATATPAASRFLAPFDQTNGATVGLALANTSTASATVSVAVRTSDGSVTQGSLTIPAQGHLAVPLQNLGGAIGNAVTNKSGLAEFYSSSQNLAILTLRFNATNSFTAAPVYAQAGPPVIGTGGGSTASPFSHLFVSGLWTLGSTAGFILFDVTPVGDGTYKAAVISQQPLVLMSFQKGTLQGQTLSFNSVSMGGFYGTSPVTGGTLTLTVNNFYQPGSAVSGSLTVNTTSGGISGTATYLP